MPHRLLLTPVCACGLVEQQYYEQRKEATRFLVAEKARALTLMQQAEQAEATLEASKVDDSAVEDKELAVEVTELEVEALRALGNVDRVTRALKQAGSVKSIMFLDAYVGRFMGGHVSHVTVATPLLLTTTARLCSRAVTALALPRR